MDLFTFGKCIVNKEPTEEEEEEEENRSKVRIIKKQIKCLIKKYRLLRTMDSDLWRMKWHSQRPLGIVH